MRYHNIDKCDILNGEGIRVVLYVSHCEHFCKECHNPQTWDSNSGIEFNQCAKNEIFEELSKEYVSGLTLSGGDPLSILNRKFTLELLKEVKSKFPNKNIWCYTGYTWEQIEDLDHVNYIDVLVDGKYLEALSVPSPQWCGSSNQRVIDVQESLKQNKAVLYKGE